MKQAKLRCPDAPALCANELATTLARVEDALARHRETPAAAKSGDGRTSGVLEVAAKEAFYDLREGERDCLLEIVEVR